MIWCKTSNIEPDISSNLTFVAKIAMVVTVAEMDEKAVQFAGNIAEKPKKSSILELETQMQKHSRRIHIPKDVNFENFQSMSYNPTEDLWLDTTLTVLNWN